MVREEKIQFRKKIGGVDVKVISTPIKFIAEDFVGGRDGIIPQNPLVLRISKTTSDKIEKKRVTTSFPEDILNYPSLEDIEIEQNNIDNVDILTELPRLKRLKLWTNIKHLPENIDEMRQLERLSLIWNMNLKELPKNFYKLSNLKELDISGSKIHEFSPEIQNMHNLINIHLHCVPINKFPKEMEQLERLKTVYIDSFCSHILGKDMPLINSLEDLHLPRGVERLSIDRLNFKQLKNFKGIQKPELIAQILYDAGTYSEFGNWNANIGQMENFDKHPNFRGEYSKILAKCYNYTKHTTEGLNRGHNFLQYEEEQLRPCYDILFYDYIDEGQCVGIMDNDIPETDFGGMQRVCKAKLIDNRNITTQLIESLEKKKQIGKNLKDIMTIIGEEGTVEIGEHKIML